MCRFCIGDITCFGLSYTMHLWRFIHFLTLATFPLQNYFQAWNQCKTISLVMPAWPAMVVMWPTLRDASKGPSPFIQIALHLLLLVDICIYQHQTQSDPATNLLAWLECYSAQEVLPGWYTMIGRMQSVTSRSLLGFMDPPGWRPVVSNLWHI